MPAVRNPALKPKGLRRGLLRLLAGHECPEPSPETKGIKTLGDFAAVQFLQVRNPALKPKGLRPYKGNPASTRFCPEPSPETKGIKTQDAFDAPLGDGPEPSPETKGIKTRVSNLGGQ